MYHKPTEKHIKYAIKEGWEREEAERGYTIFSLGDNGPLHVERIDDAYSPNDDIDDEDCAKEAEKNGYCKIIPVSELPVVMYYMGRDLRFFGWVDTPENREHIKRFFSEQ